MNTLICEGGRCTRENDIAHKALHEIHSFIEFIHTDNDGNLCEYSYLTREKTVIKRGRDPIEKAVLKCFKAVRKYYTELNDLEPTQLITFDNKGNMYLSRAEGPSNEEEL